MNICGNADILKVIYFFLLIIDIVKIIIPIALIIYGLIDFSKVVINGDEKAGKTTVQLFFKRILYGVLVFTVPWIVEVLMITLGDLLGEERTMNFTDCLDNANKTCLEAIDSKNIDTIKSNCDVPDDYVIVDDNDNKDSNTNNEVCWQCNDNPNLLQWGKTYSSDANCHAGWHQINYTYLQCKKTNVNNDIIISDKNITFSYKWVTSDVMPYALYTPSSAKKNSSTPLIIWLHGAGEVNANENTFKNSGLLAVMNNWKLEGFNAYVLCPRSSGSWVHQKNEVYSVIDNIIREKNINTKKIILVGHSLGGIGVETIADGKTNYYSALVVLSGYNSGVNLNQFKNIPVRGYVGGRPEGNLYYEDTNSLYYMEGSFKKTFGSENLYVFDKTGHGDVPRKAFTLDENNDNKSDLIEWMLKQ